MSGLGFRKILCEKDEVREMLIASAYYPTIACSQETLTQTNSRKRRGTLCGLSEEEKIRRKKLKNREAAQTSRDKKKAYVTQLENAVTELQEENSLLTQKMQELLEENKKLKEKTQTLEQELLEISVGRGKEERSAVPSPQQKEPSYLLALTQMILPILNLTSMILTGLKNLANRSTLMNSQNWPKPLLMKHLSWRMKNLNRKWWGPSQHSWNPVGMLLLHS